jgi:hypothetical protein
MSSLLFLANKLQRSTFLAWKHITPVLVAIRRRLRLATAKRKQAITLWCSTVLRQWRYVACQRIMGRVLQRKHELAHAIPQVSVCRYIAFGFDCILRDASFLLVGWKA